MDRPVHGDQASRRLLSSPAGAGKPGFRVDRRRASYSQAPAGHAGRGPAEQDAAVPGASHIPTRLGANEVPAAAVTAASAEPSASGEPSVGRAPEPEPPPRAGPGLPR